MDRETILRVSKGRHNLEVLNVDVALFVLRQFLIEEHDKPIDKVSIFINYIVSKMIWVEFFDVALVHYEKKFCITKVFDKTHKLLKIF